MYVGVGFKFEQKTYVCDKEEEDTRKGQLKNREKTINNTLP